MMIRKCLLPVIGFAMLGCGRLGYDPLTSTNDGGVTDGDVRDGAQLDAALPATLWWDCAWPSRRSISLITEGAAVTPPYSVRVTFDHAAMVASGSSLVSGDDIRIMHFDGSAWTELDRVLDPDSSWGASDTRLWFSLVDSQQASSVSPLSYFLYHGNPAAGPAPANAANVFHYADLFDRADAANVGGGWTISDSSTGLAGNIDLSSNALFFENINQADNRPIADHTFPAISSELAWRIGFNWQRTGAESTYRLHMQMGNSGAMAALPSTSIFSQVGVGPSLVWVSPDQGAAAHETLGYEIAQSFTELSVVSGRASIEVVARVAAGEYDIFVDGVPLAQGILFSTAQSQLDQLRLMPFDIGHLSFASRDFDYVIVRQHVSPEPQALPAGAQLSDCP